METIKTQLLTQLYELLNPEVVYFLLYLLGSENGTLKSVARIMFPLICLVVERSVLLLCFSSEPRFVSLMSSLYILSFINIK